MGSTIAPSGLLRESYTDAFSGGMGSFLLSTPSSSLDTVIPCLLAPSALEGGLFEAAFPAALTSERTEPSELSTEAFRTRLMKFAISGGRLAFLGLTFSYESGTSTFSRENILGSNFIPCLFGADEARMSALVGGASCSARGRDKEREVVAMEGGPRWEMEVDLGPLSPVASPL